MKSFLKTFARNAKVAGPNKWYLPMLETIYSRWQMRFETVTPDRLQPIVDTNNQQIEVNHRSFVVIEIFSLLMIRLFAGNHTSISGIKPTNGGSIFKQVADFLTSYKVELSSEQAAVGTQPVRGLEVLILMCLPHYLQYEIATSLQDKCKKALYARHISKNLEYQHPSFLDISLVLGKNVSQYNTRGRLNIQRGITTDLDNVVYDAMDKDQISYPERFVTFQRHRADALTNTNIVRQNDLERIIKNFFIWIADIYGLDMDESDFNNNHVEEFLYNMIVVYESQATTPPLVPSDPVAIEAITWIRYIRDCYDRVEFPWLRYVPHTSEFMIDAIPSLQDDAYIRKGMKVTLNLEDVKDEETKHFMFVAFIDTNSRFYKLKEITETGIAKDFRERFEVMFTVVKQHSQFTFVNSIHASEQWQKDYDALPVKDVHLLAKHIHVRYIEYSSSTNLYRIVVKDVHSDRKISTVYNDLDTLWIIAEFLPMHVLFEKHVSFNELLTKAYYSNPMMDEFFYPQTLVTYDRMNQPAYSILETQVAFAPRDMYNEEDREEVYEQYFKQLGGIPRQIVLKDSVSEREITIFHDVNDPNRVPNDEMDATDKLFAIDELFGYNQKSHGLKKLSLRWIVNHQDFVKWLLPNGYLGDSEVAKNTAKSPMYVPLHDVIFPFMFRANTAKDEISTRLVYSWPAKRGETYRKYSNYGIWANYGDPEITAVIGNVADFRLTFGGYAGHIAPASLDAVVAAQYPYGMHKFADTMNIVVAGADVASLERGLITAGFATTNDGTKIKCDSKYNTYHVISPSVSQIILGANATPILYTSSNIDVKQKQQLIQIEDKLILLTIDNGGTGNKIPSVTLIVNPALAYFNKLLLAVMSEVTKKGTWTETTVLRYIEISAMIGHMVTASGRPRKEWMQIHA